MKKWLNTCLSLSYARELGNKTVLKLAMSNMLAYYALGDVNPGDITMRYGWLLDLSYCRLLAAPKGWQVYGVLGGTYRRGSEFIFLYVRGESANQRYLLREPGLHAGLHVSRNLFWRLRFEAGLRFTQFLFRYDDGSEYRENYRNRSTGNMLSLDTGIGFRF